MPSLRICLKLLVGGVEGERLHVSEEIFHSAVI